MAYSTDSSLSFVPTIKWSKPDKKVWVAMRRRLSTGRGLCVEIGWFRGNVHIGKSGVVLPTAQIAKWNEEGHMTGGKYGVHIVPPRPFMRVGFIHNIESSREARESFVSLTQQVAEGNMTWEQAYNRLGAIMLQRLQKAIKMDIYVSNTPLTISLKGHGVTLIDTGQMLNTVEYRVGRSRG
jgi:hypothetical protein